jgi:hypothetical protein
MVTVDLLVTVNQDTQGMARKGQSLKRPPSFLTLCQWYNPPTEVLRGVLVEVLMEDLVEDLVVVCSEVKELDFVSFLLIVIDYK